MLRNKLKSNIKDLKEYSGDLSGNLDINYSGNRIILVGKTLYNIYAQKYKKYSKITDNQRK